MTTKYGPIIEPGFFDGTTMQLQGSDEDRSILLVLLELRSYSMSNEQDGFVADYQLRKATMHSDPAAAVERLKDLGEVERAVREVDGRKSDGWQVNWDDQLTAEKITETKAKRADWDRHKNGNHRECGRYPNYACHKNGAYKGWQDSHPDLCAETDTETQMGSHVGSQSLRVVKGRVGKTESDPDLSGALNADDDSVAPAGAPQRDSSAGEDEDYEQEDSAPNVYVPTLHQSYQLGEEF